MGLNKLRSAIKTKDARLAVIGLGYVGLPLACEFARVGFDVIGVEILPERVNKINNGISPIEGNEPGLAELLDEVVGNKKLRATANYADLKDRDVVFINVETPVDENHIPHYSALKSALKNLAPVLKRGALVIVESTIAPRTMYDVVLPILEGAGQVNQDFYLGNCPERVMPGKLLANIRTVSRVVGGMTPETADVMVWLYQHIVRADLDPTDCLTAELVKTTENAYRDVNIAFANEVALICEAMGGDVWKVRELVNKSPGRNMLLPGAGVGGHCIPKDPWLLVHGSEGNAVPTRLIPAARAVNDYMPTHLVNILEKALENIKKKLSDARILVMGYAYMEDSDDTRNSPSEILVKQLRKEDAEVVIHDPFVPGYQSDLLTAAQGCDAVILMVRHQQYLHLDLKKLKSVLKSPIVIDGRHTFDTHEIKANGFIYRGIGIHLDG